MLQFSDRRRRPAIQLNMQNVNMFPQEYQPIAKLPSFDPDTPTYSEPNSSVDGVKVINRWGPPTWLMLHTLAEKVKEDSFPLVRKELLNIILMICLHLPCPTCAGHATEYLDKIKLDRITNKEQLKEMLFTFHNTVNKRKQYELFPLEELDSKYSSAVTANILQNFIFYYGQRYITNRLSVDGFHRKILIQRLMDWFQQNNQHFLP
jgi:Erv1 / Alr family